MPDEAPPDPPLVTKSTPAWKVWRDTPIKKWHLDTTQGWLLMSILTLVIALSCHQTAMAFDIYEHPPHPDLRIDVYTHAFSSFALVAIFLNFDLGRKTRWWYWGVPILGALAFGVVWEVFEEAVIRLDIIAFYNTGWNALQDTFMDVMGGVVAGYLCDVFVD